MYCASQYTSLIFFLIFNTELLVFVFYFQVYLPIYLSRGAIFSFIQTQIFFLISSSPSFTAVCYTVYSRIQASSLAFDNHLEIGTPFKEMLGTTTSFQIKCRRNLCWTTEQYDWRKINNGNQNWRPIIWFTPFGITT